MSRKLVLVMCLTLVLTGMFGVALKVQRVEASGTIFIRADGRVEPDTANITSADNVTYTFTGNINESIVVEKDNIVVDGAGYTLQGTGSGRGIDLTGRSNVTIKNMRIQAFDYGIWLYYSLNNTISGNNITNNGNGIYLYRSSDNSISGNNITENSGSGIGIRDSSNNNVSGNNITNNSHGIWLGESSNNTISGNTITNNNYPGVLLDNSQNNIISGNSLSNNEYGIRLATSSNNTIYEDNISNNDYGIYLEESSNNKFYHNNFVDNIKQVYIWISYANFWDDGVEGNYWSDYTEVDLNHDGIGDKSRVIDANNKDNNPLMGMFHSFKTPPGYYVNVISNSTIEDFQYFEANSTIKIYVSNMTANQTFGFCRVCIPHALMDPNNIWVVIDDGQTEVLFANFTLYDNTTHRWIYFAYPHSTHEVVFGEDNTPPLIENVYQQPAEDTVYPDDKVEVYANVTDNLSGVKQVILNYTINNVEWFSINMTNLEGNLYNATIPEFSYCTNVTYVIIAEDNANNTITTEEMEYEYQYHVIPEFPTWTSMLLMLIALTVAIVIYKRRLHKTPIH